MLQVKAIFALLFRVLLIAVCGFAAPRSIRTAVADWLMSAGTLDGFERANRFAPDDARLLARWAVYRSNNDDPSPAVDEDLRRAARLNPFDSAVLMTLGLREEFRGNTIEAERYLVRAAEIDRQFKPAWTLANYYYRANQPEKGWPMIQRILSLEPLGFDPSPVFELCWRQVADLQATDNQATGNQKTADQVAASRKILGLIPKRGHKPVQYLEFLIGSHRADAAVDAWPEALAAADRADPSDISTLTGLVDFLADADRLEEAITVWNQLVDRGIINSGHLAPAKGVSIADPDFKFEPLAKVFGWRVADVPGVFASGFSGSVRFEITGDEPQSFQFLSTLGPVLSDTPYRLRWKSDGSSLTSPDDPGFSFRIIQQPGGLVTQCLPLLSAGNSGSCDFVTLAETRKVRIELGYARALGTKLATGVLQLFNVRLELAR
jgi:pentatricopeptide repeat protein